MQIQFLIKLFTGFFKLNLFKLLLFKKFVLIILEKAVLLQPILIKYLDQYESIRNCFHLESRFI